MLALYCLLTITRCLNKLSQLLHTRTLCSLEQLVMVISIKLSYMQVTCMIVLARELDPDLGSLLSCIYLAVGLASLVGPCTVLCCAVLCYRWAPPWSASSSTPRPPTASPSSWSAASSSSGHSVSPPPGSYTRET